ncbi:hypothetical protein HDU98_007720 [Podochytrium sp. JEL0797]|nr:hypothetical protein HDU98_007720 [Podochytrium sp. JEL0797]
MSDSAISKEGGQHQTETLQLRQEPVEAKVRVGEAFALPDKDSIYYSLLAVSSVFGYAVYATSRGFGCAMTRDVQRCLKQAAPRQWVAMSGAKTFETPGDHVCQIRLNASHETVCIGFNSGKILLYQAASLAKGHNTPFKSFECPNQEDFVMLPNPEAYPTKCAILCAGGAVFMLDMESAEFAPLSSLEDITCMCWSRKGKQLAVGGLKGVVQQVTLQGVIKNTIPPPPNCAEDSMTVQHILWLEDKTFVVVYQIEEEAHAYVITQSGKAKTGISTTYTKLEDPCPFPAEGRLRANYFNSLVTSMGDISYLIPYANFASTEFGFLALQNGAWNKWILGDSSISLPFDKNDDDTYPMGLDMDFTSTDLLKSTHPDQPDLPAGPLLYVLNSAGCLLVYHLVDTTAAGRDVVCNGMIAAKELPRERSVSPKRGKSPSKKSSTSPKREKSPEKTTPATPKLAPSTSQPTPTTTTTTTEPRGRSPARPAPLITTPTTPSPKKWVCDTCMVPNEDSATQCVACETKRAGSWAPASAGHAKPSLFGTAVKKGDPVSITSGFSFAPPSPAAKDAGFVFGGAAKEADGGSTGFGLAKGVTASAASVFGAAAVGGSTGFGFGAAKEVGSGFSFVPKEEGNPASTGFSFAPKEAASTGFGFGASAKSEEAAKEETEAASVEPAAAPKPFGASTGGFSFLSAASPAPAPAAPLVSAFGSTTSAFTSTTSGGGGSVFGKTSGLASAGTSVFGQSSAFGQQSAFGQSTGTGDFSFLGSAAAATSTPIKKGASQSAFGAFAGSGPSPFGAKAGGAEVKNGDKTPERVGGVAVMAKSPVVPAVSSSQSAFGAFAGTGVSPFGVKTPPSVIPVAVKKEVVEKRDKSPITKVVKEEEEEEEDAKKREKSPEKVVKLEAVLLVKEEVPKRNKSPATVAVKEKALAASIAKVEDPVVKAPVAAAPKTKEAKKRGVDSAKEEQRGEIDVHFIEARQIPSDVKVRVSESLNDTHASDEQLCYDLLAVSNKFGYVVFGTAAGFGFALTKDVRDTISKSPARQTVEIATKFEVELNDEGYLVNQIRLSADERVVFVGLTSGTILTYEASLLVSGEIEPSNEFHGPNDENFVILPNPEAFPHLCAVNYGDGTVCMLNIETSEFVPIAEEVFSMCWSRKGKQLAVGNEEGLVNQVSVEGVVKNTIAVPPGLVGKEIGVQSIVWLEDKVFVVIYGVTDEDCAAYVISQSGTAKTGIQTTYTRLENPCPYPKDERDLFYYPALVESLGDSTYLMPFANHASTDIGFLGCKNGEWNTWRMGDPLQLPLDADDDETFPVGMSIDFVSQERVKSIFPDQPSLCPAPLLYVLTNAGCLVVYNLVEAGTAGREVACPAMRASVEEFEGVDVPVVKKEADAGVSAKLEVPVPVKEAMQKRDKSPEKAVKLEAPSPVKEEVPKRDKSPEKVAVKEEGLAAAIAKMEDPVVKAPVAAPAPKTKEAKKRGVDSAKEEQRGEIDVDFIEARQIPSDVKVRVSKSLNETHASDEQLCYDLLAVSNKFGYVVFGTASGFGFALTKDVRDTISKVRSCFVENEVRRFLTFVPSKASSRQVVEVASKFEVELNEEDYLVNQIRLSADEKVVFVGLTSGAILTYEASLLASGEIEPSNEFHGPNDENFVILPNPEAFPHLCAVNYGDGTVCMLNIESSEFVPIAEEVFSMCWSRKGKQLAVGNEEGLVNQVSVEGVVKNTIAVPPGLVGKEIGVQSIVWLEDKVFVVIYGVTDEDCAAYVISQSGTAKTGIQTTYTRLENPCPYPKDERDLFYYPALVEFLGDSTYLMPFANHASTDIGFLGCKNGEWNTWRMGDPLQLPLDANDDETFPVGLGIDFVSQERVKSRFPDQPSLCPAPLLYVLTSAGYLVVYNLVEAGTAGREVACPAMRTSVENLEVVAASASKPTQKQNSLKIDPEKSPAPAFKWGFAPGPDAATPPAAPAFGFATGIAASVSFGAPPPASSAAGFSFKPTETAKPSAPAPKSSSVAKWVCDTCMVPNEDSATQCVACETKRVGGATSAKPSLFGDAKPASAGGFSFAPSAKPAASAPGGFSFRPAETAAPAAKSTSGAKWVCDTCMVPNEDSATQCVACETKRVGGAAPAKPSLFGNSIGNEPTSGSGGFSFTAPKNAAPVVGGFSFKSVDGSKPETPSGGGFSFGSPAPAIGKPDCAVFGASAAAAKPPLVNPAPKASVAASFTFPAQPATSKTVPSTPKPETAKAPVKPQAATPKSTPVTAVPTPTKREAKPREYQDPSDYLGLFDRMRAELDDDLKDLRVTVSTSAEFVTKAVKNSSEILQETHIQITELNKKLTHVKIDCEKTVSRKDELVDSLKLISGKQEHSAKLLKFIKKESRELLDFENELGPEFAHLQGLLRKKVKQMELELSEVKASLLQMKEGLEIRTGAKTAAKLPDWDTLCRNIRRITSHSVTISKKLDAMLEEIQLYKPSTSPSKQVKSVPIKSKNAFAAEFDSDDSDGDLIPKSSAQLSPAVRKQLQFMTSLKDAAVSASKAAKAAKAKAASQQPSVASQAPNVKAGFFASKPVAAALATKPPASTDGFSFVASKSPAPTVAAPKPPVPSTEGFSFGGPKAPVAVPASKPTSSTSGLSFGAQKAPAPATQAGFGTSSVAAKPTAGAKWVCNTCMVPNEGSATQCVACETKRVGGAAPTKPPLFGDSKPATTGGFSFAPAASGFGFKPSDVAAPAAPAPAPKISPGAKWVCDTCMVPNEDSATQCVACETKRVGGAAQAKPSLFADSKPVVAGGFSLAPSAKPSAPSAGGFSFKATEAAEPSVIAPKSTSGAKWVCDTCMVPNDDSATQCVACETKRVGGIAPAKPSLFGETKPAQPVPVSGGFVGASKTDTGMKGGFSFSLAKDAAPSSGGFGSATLKDAAAVDEKSSMPVVPAPVATGFGQSLTSTLPSVGASATASVFGVSNSTPAPPSPQAFKATVPLVTPTPIGSSQFGATKPEAGAPSTGSNTFGLAPAALLPEVPAAVAQGFGASLSLGGPSASQNKVNPMFASAFSTPAASTPAPSAFGTASASTSVFGSGGGSGSVFGKPSLPSTPAASGFSFLGAAASQGVSPAPAVTPSSQSAFGAFGGSGASPFGAKTSVFGQPSTPAPVKPAFGSNNATPAFGQSAFGQPAAPSSGSAFGGATAPSAFGQTATTSAFGAPPAGQSAFGQSSFGQASPGQSAFGGQAANPAVSAFGQAAAPSAFGQTSAPAFGQSGFGSSGGAFGQSGFGAPAAVVAPTGFPSVASNKSVFGQSSGAGAGGFGGFASTSNQSVFGGGSGGSQASAFGAAASNSGGSVFGAAPSSDKKPSFSQYR